MPALKKSDFSYSLPPELIAQAPLPERAASRLLCLDGRNGHIEDRPFSDLPRLLHAGDLLVFNDTRVIPARLFGTKDSGGRIELLVERVLDGSRVLAQCRASKTPKPGQTLHFGHDVRARTGARHGEFHEIEFEAQEPLPALLDLVRSGEITDVKTVIGLFWLEKLLRGEWVAGPALP